jgi:hypothetical protein
MNCQTSNDGRVDPGRTFDLGIWVALLNALGGYGTVGNCCGSP